MSSWQIYERERRHYATDYSCSRSGGGTTTKQLTGWQEGKRVNMRIRIWPKFWKSEKKGWTERNGTEKETMTELAVNLNAPEVQPCTMEILVTDHTAKGSSHPAVAVTFQEVE
jgi:hypothetical protein